MWTWERGERTDEHVVSKNIFVRKMMTVSAAEQLRSSGAGVRNLAGVKGEYV